MDTIKNIFCSSAIYHFTFYILHSPAQRSARACTFAFLLCHPERSGERHVSRAVERVLRGAYRKTNAFAVFGTTLPFYTRSLDCAPIGAPLRMTECGLSPRSAPNDRGASRMRRALSHCPMPLFRRLRRHTEGEGKSATQHFLYPSKTLKYTCRRLPSRRRP